MNRLSTLSRSIQGSSAIVTGAASGMGRATAHLFADEGARLALLDIDTSALAGVAEECRCQRTGDAGAGSARGLSARCPFWQDSAFYIDFFDDFFFHEDDFLGL